MAKPGALIGRGRAAEVFEWDDGRVVKLFHPGVPPSWPRHEWETTRAVHASGVACPEVGDLVEVGGRHGILYERIDGPPLLSVIARRPWRVVWAARLMAQLHAGMHACRSDQLPPARERLRAAIERAPDLPADDRQAALRALESLPDGDRVCHGDFHPDNIVLSRRGPVVLDWANASRGCPEADAARTSLMLQIGEPPSGTPLRPLIDLLRRALHAMYLSRYRRLRGVGQARIDAWMLPVAAGRADERIVEERGRLLALIARARGGG
jgi:uncharacterized protein (TIGR02172 family)